MIIETFVTQVPRPKWTVTEVLAGKEANGFAEKVSVTLSYMTQMVVEQAAIAPARVVKWLPST